MRPKILKINLIVKIAATIFTLGLIYVNYRYFSITALEPFDIYILISFIIMTLAIWIPLKSQYVIVLEPKKAVKPKKEVVKHE